MLPQLRELERRYANRVAVIGVHSAKFPAERATEAVAQAVRRHAIHHPVVNDHEFKVWQAYACRAWPTLMFVDPKGKVIGRHEGEFEVSQVVPAIEQMLAEFDAAGWLDTRPLDFGDAGPAAQLGPTGPLAFPGKIAVETRGRGHVYVADSNHHRLVIMGLAVQDGAVHHIVGAGTPGLEDGPPEAARFNWPQGMAIDHRTGVVYVADTENHAIRRMSPDGGRISTIAGTGKQARSFGGGGKGPETPLSSPWDLAFLPDPAARAEVAPGSHEDPHDDHGVLFIAMAGLHQIWAMDLANGTLGPFAGTGREALVDGQRDQACFAQPSGLALDGAGETLFVADSETSAIRSIDLRSGEVGTLVGAGLFEFGDVDGAADIARLQHPVGLTVWEDDPDGPSILVADTYNHKIKRIDRRTREVRTFLAGELSEPGGLAVARGQLFIADANHHRVAVVDLTTRALGTLAVDESRRAH
ncbi:MAG TPA: thioredoxin-like domain-containing protein [Chloroflexota bacterium]|nr:thioredoxin-like domain-containing protein [Chloroflexota bacterium]